MSEESYELTGPMADYFWRKWLGGGLAAIYFFTLGCKAMILMKTTIYYPSRAQFYHEIHLEGMEALLTGVCYVMLALTAHFALFWRYQKPLVQYHQPLMYLSSLAFALSFLGTCGYIYWVRVLAFM